MSKQSVSRRRKVSDAAVDRMWRKFARSPAQLTGEQVERIERAVQTDGVARRIALAALSFSGAELIEKFGREADRDSAAANAAGVAWIEGYMERLKSLLGLMETASLRGKLAMMEREDYNELLAEGRDEKAAA